MWTWLHKLGSPERYYNLADKLAPWLGFPAAILILIGLYGGLILSPADYQQGDSFRIIYIHVPAAWMSMFVYVFMATNAAIGLIWRIKVSDLIARSSAGIGASFTFLALFTGVLWGEPTWGKGFDLDPRILSELLLLFLYIGYIALYNAIEDPRSAARSSAILAIVGVVNIPIIHYSVVWWNSLHQGPIISSNGFSIAGSMLWPLLVMVVAFQLFFFYVLLRSSQSRLLERERNSKWVLSLAEKEQSNV